MAIPVELGWVLPVFPIFWRASLIEPVANEIVAGAALMGLLPCRSLSANGSS
jgi:hypothetical protein